MLGQGLCPHGFVRNERFPFVLADFIISTTVGTGTFGRVCVAQHIESGKWYALKILKKSEVRMNLFGWSYLFLATGLVPRALCQPLLASHPLLLHPTLLPLTFYPPPFPSPLPPLPLPLTPPPRRS